MLVAIPFLCSEPALSMLCLQLSDKIDYLLDLEFRSVEALTTS
jgi:hypothetical protein